MVTAFALVNGGETMRRKSEKENYQLRKLADELESKSALCLWIMVLP